MRNTPSFQWTRLFLGAALAATVACGAPAAGEQSGEVQADVAVASSEAASTSAVGNLYIAQGGQLHRVDDETGDRGVLSANWGYSTSAATIGNSLYFLKDDFLVRVDPATGFSSTVGSA